MPILKIKDENGKVYEILALRGPRGLKGEDAYAKVVEYGYEGDEEEFYLAMSKNGKAPDKTLSTPGEAADAGATGSEIESLYGRISEVDMMAQGKAEIEHFEVLVEFDAWVQEDDGIFSQTIASDTDGIRRGDHLIYEVVLNGDDDLAYIKCLGKVLFVQALNDSIKVWATEAIDTMFTLRLLAIRG